MQFFIANDHAGLALKPSVMEILMRMEHQVIDLGSNGNVRVDYPDIANLLCQNVLENAGSFGVLICGSGIGMSIAANRHKGIRAALCTEPYSATMSRAHNDANVLCLGARVVGIGIVESILQSFCAGVFEGGRHLHRIKKLQ